MATQQVPLRQVEVILAKQTRSTNFSVANASSVKVDTDVATKTIGDINNDTTNKKITINKAGFYVITAYVSATASAGGQFRIVGIRKNGATVTDTYFAKTATSGDFRASLTDGMQLVAGDYIELGFYQDSGGALNVTGWIMVERVGD